VSLALIQALVHSRENVVGPILAYNCPAGMMSSYNIVCSVPIDIRVTSHVRLRRSVLARRMYGNGSILY